MFVRSYKCFRMIREYIVKQGEAEEETRRVEASSCRTRRLSKELNFVLSCWKAIEWFHVEDDML